FAKFFAQALKDDDPAAGEPAQQQHTPAYCVNYAPYSLIVQQKIHKLRDLDIINRNLCFTFRGNNQVLLLRIYVQPHVPYGCSEGTAASQIGACEVCAHQAGIFEVCSSEVGSVKFCMMELCRGEVRLAQNSVG